VLADLPHGRHLVVPGMAHGVTVRGCVPTLVKRFLEAPQELSRLDTNCIGDEAPPFFVGRHGPPP
jgi:hypothetical protein